MILNLLMQHKKLISFILGITSAAALPPFYAVPLLFVTLSGLLLLINQSSNKFRAFSIGYSFGFGYFACNLSWIGNALLIDYAHFGWLYPIVLLASGGFFGLFIAFPALLCFFFKNLVARYLSFAAFWVIFEWIRSFIFTGFPWNLLGSVLAFSPTTIQLASVIGTYGLSLIVLMITTAPALMIYYHNKVSFWTSTAIICGLSLILWGFGEYRLRNVLKTSTTPTPVIRLVQPSIPQAMKWNRQALEENFQQYIKLSQAPGLDKVDFVIWGETATPFPLDMEPQYLEQITAAIPQNGYLLTGAVRYERGETEFQPVNSMFVINKQGEIINYYDKSHLVPFGEYIPFRQYFPSWIKPVTNTISDFVPGTGPKVIKVGNLPSFGALICYEIIFPNQIVDKNIRPNWLVNLTNDGWYGRSAGPYQHLVTTQLRAVEEGLSIIRAANTGISAAISPYGEIISSIALDEKAYVDISLPPKLFLSTIYANFGNWLSLILCLINIIGAFLIRLPFR